MFVKIIKDCKGAPQGHTVLEYEKDKIFEVGSGAMPESLAKTFMEGKLAVKVDPPKTAPQDAVPDDEDEPIGAAEATGEPEDEGDGEPDPETMPLDEIKAWLNEKEIKFPANMDEAKLRDLYKTNKK